MKDRHFEQKVNRADNGRFTTKHKAKQPDAAEMHHVDLVGSQMESVTSPGWSKEIPVLKGDGLTVMSTGRADKPMRLRFQQERHFVQFVVPKDGMPAADTPASETALRQYGPGVHIKGDGGTLDFFSSHTLDSKDIHLALWRTPTESGGCKLSRSAAEHLANVMDAAASRTAEPPHSHMINPEDSCHLCSDLCDDGELEPKYVGRAVASIEMGDGRSPVPVCSDCSS